MGSERDPKGSFSPIRTERRRPLPGLTQVSQRLTRRGKRVALVALIALGVGLPLAFVISEHAAKQRDAREARQAAVAAREAARRTAEQQRPHTGSLAPGGHGLDPQAAAPALARAVGSFAAEQPGQRVGATRCTLRRVEHGGRFATYGCIVFDAGRGDGRGSALGRPFVGRVDLQRRRATWCASIPVAATSSTGLDAPISKACIGSVQPPRPSR
jgi:hypothetical protein